MEKNIAIMGVGSLAVYTADLAEECGYNVIGYLYLRDDIDINGYKIHGKPVFTISNLPEDCEILVAIEDPFDKKTLINTAEAFNIVFTSLVHPTANVNSATVRDGCIVGRNVNLGEKTLIDRFVQIMDNVIIDDYSHVKSYLTIESGIHIDVNSVVGVS